MKELKPNAKYYVNFPGHAAKKFCTKCGQPLSAKPQVKFYFEGYVQGKPDMLRVRISGRKKIQRIHKGYFEEIQ